MQENGSPRSFRRVQKESGLWLMSFSDMSLILLSFFVLMVSVMTPQKQKFDNVNSGLRKEIVEKKVDSLEGMSQKLSGVIKTQDLSNAAVVNLDANGLRIEFKSGILFGSGSAEVNTDFEAVTTEVMKVLAGIGGPYRMVIEGHTDDVPPRSGSRYASNWELSAARGFALMRRFQELGLSEERMAVMAYAHTKPKMSIDQLKGEALVQARAANRRVVVRIE